MKNLWIRLADIVTDRQIEELITDNLQEEAVTDLDILSETDDSETDSDTMCNLIVISQLEKDINIPKSDNT